MVPIRPFESVSCEKGKKTKKRGPAKFGGTPCKGRLIACLLECYFTMSLRMALTCSPVMRTK